MPVILAAWETKIRLEVPDQLAQKKFVRPHLVGKILGIVALTCHPSNSGTLSLE
jgi:hypothetical protein